MTRLAAIVVGCSILCGAAADADADRRRHDRPVMFEVGVNTRHFAASDPADVAFRTADPQDTSMGDGTALTTSLRFTGRTPYDTFVGVEAETGTLLGYDSSNLAGAYGVGGARIDLRAVRLAVELVTGRRWVRYAMNYASSDDSDWIFEPRVRGDFWLGQHVTLGGAAGATLSDRAVWMAGIYIGINSSAFGQW
jgi:hypothetical protein